MLYHLKMTSTNRHSTSSYSPPQARTAANVLVLLTVFFLVGDTNAFTVPTTTGILRNHVQRTRASVELYEHQQPLKIIFSDIDGSLVHYHDNNDDDNSNNSNNNKNNPILSLPPSATGMKGIISMKTLALCRDLRRDKNIKLVLVSGMRTSTLLNRLPFLPRADAYCTEAGGRIFYPTTPAVAVGGDDDDNDDDDDYSEFFPQWSPMEFDGATAMDLEPFGLREDKKWRQQMEQDTAAGVDGYAGNEVFSDRCEEGIDDDDEECLIDYENPMGFPIQKDVIPVDQRNGILWKFANELQEQFDGGAGFVLDTKSYSTCFRVNKKHQTGEALEKFDDLLNGNIIHPPELAKSTNLGCIDFFPISSGKRNCCQYIAHELGIDLSFESACICDDDNDIEMALACSQAYIPALTSGSMELAVKENPTKFVQTFREGSVNSTLATDAALHLICESA